jgi:hypothetical protein
VPAGHAQFDPVKDTHLVQCDPRRGMALVGRGVSGCGHILVDCVVDRLESVMAWARG